jgi:hypothetical protein
MTRKKRVRLDAATCRWCGERMTDHFFDGLYTAEGVVCDKPIATTDALAAQEARRGK